MDDIVSRQDGRGKPLTFNDWADFWRYNVGINVIPADTKNKTTYVKWSEWQNKPIPEEVHNQWKTENAFSKGMAVLPGAVWHNEAKKGLYFTFIDADKSETITGICTRNGKTISLQEMSQQFLVEQHRDSPDKAHIYFYSPMPFVKKSADTVIGLEVKGLGEHGIAYCSPTENDQNDAQKSDTGGNGAIGGIFPTSMVDVGVQLQEVDINTTASPQSFLFKCYHCDNYQTNIEGDYQRHVILNHPGKPCYPSRPDLERLGLKGMGKKWEI